MQNVGRYVAIVETDVLPFQLLEACNARGRECNKTAEIGIAFKNSQRLHRLAVRASDEKSIWTAEDARNVSCPVATVFTGFSSCEPMLNRTLRPSCE